MKFVVLLFILLMVPAIGYTITALKVRQQEPKEKTNRDYGLNEDSLEQLAKSAVIGFVIGLVAVLFINKCWIIVGPAETVAIYKVLGSNRGIQNYDLGEGWHFITPFAQTRKYPTRLEEYTMSATPDEGATVGDDSMPCQTKEGLGVKIDSTILFRIPKGGGHNVWRSIGQDYNNVLVRPSTRNIVKLEVSNYNIMAVYSNANLSTKGVAGTDYYAGKREEIETKITQSLKKQFAPKGLEVNWFLLRNVAYSNEEYENSIIEKQVAQQSIATENYKAQTKKVAATKKRVLAEGESQSIRLKAQALKVDPRLVGLEWVNKIGANEGVTIDMLPKSGGALPLLHLNGRGEQIAPTE